MSLTQKNKKDLRDRWSEDIILRFNTDFIKSVPKRPVWPMDQLSREIPSHEVKGEKFVDLRGVTFYELRHMRWDHVDMSGAQFRKGIMESPENLGKGLIGTGSIGGVTSSYTHCLFSSVDASGSNIHGTFEDCDFVGAKLRSMDFSVNVRLTRCNFSGANLERCKAITNVRFSGCDFTGALMRRCRLEGTLFEDCCFDGAVLDDSGIIGVRFVQCSMKNVSLKSIISETNTFIDTDIDPF